MTALVFYLAGFAVGFLLGWCVAEQRQRHAMQDSEFRQRMTALWETTDITEPADSGDNPKEVGHA